MLTREHTRVLSSGGSVPLEQIRDLCGQGKLAPFFEEKRAGWEIEWTPYSRRYQRLPCEFEFCGQGGSTDVRITSYINDLHTQEERPFYHTLQHIISKAIEPWNKTMIRIPPPGMKKYKHSVGRQPLRIRTYGVEWRSRYPQWAEELPTTLDVDRSTEATSAPFPSSKTIYGLKVQWWFTETREIPDDWEATLPLREVVDIKYSRLFRFEHSEPGTTYSYEDWKHGRTAQAIVPREDYENRDRSPDSLWWDSDKFKDPMIHYDLVQARESWNHEFQTIKLQVEFRDKGLQVIVKLGGIELTLDTQLSFPVEDWGQKDGMLNEQIAGVAIYAFSLDNITTPRISFSQTIRMDVHEFHFDQGDDAVWDVPFLDQNSASRTMALRVKNSILCLSVKDVYSPSPTVYATAWNRLNSLTELDRGHCRFLTLWLVNPYLRICSTRNVPPQRQDWWK
ncbi:hypothetical protein BDV19DRAFT_386192 [Aspergillus venezuelensis]